MTNEPFLQLEGLCKRFGQTPAVDGVSLSLTRGQTLALLGPSGSGKTTILRMLAGFEAVDAGRIVVAGRDVTAVPPAARRFGMVFQNYALFPHLTVGGNVAFGLESLGMRGAELANRVASALAQVDLVGYESRRVDQLSGGQQQRVAVARALAPEPEVLLLDEPLSNLDPALRERTRRELRAVIRRVGITTVLVTHEQEEAFELGDRVALVRAGRLQQVGIPEELYDAPANPFVAGFVGRTSTLEGELVRTQDGRGVVRIRDVEWILEVRSGLVPGPVRVMVRPEGVRLDTVADGRLAGTVEERRFAGAASFYVVAFDGGGTIEVSASPQAARQGDRVGVAPAGRGIHLFAREEP